MNDVHHLSQQLMGYTSTQIRTQHDASLAVTEPMNGPHGNSVHSDAVVHVDVLDANDHAPKFLSRKLEAQITEEDGRHLPRVVLTVSYSWIDIVYIFLYYCHSCIIYLQIGY